MTQERAKELLDNFKESHRLLYGKLPYPEITREEYREVMDHWLESTGHLLTYDAAIKSFLKEKIRNG